MAYVAFVIDRNTTGVDVDAGRIEGDEFFLPAGEGVVNMDGHLLV